METADKLAYFKSTPLLSFVPDSDLLTLANIAHEKSYPAGATIIEENSLTNEIYFIVSGCLRVFHLRPDGSTITLSILGKNEILGEMPIFDNEPRSATVETIQKTGVLTISHAEFSTFLETHPKVMMAIMRVVIRRLREIHQKVESVATEKLVDRTYKTLQELAQHFYNHTITLTQDELADVIGATRSKVTLALHDLEAQKKIKDLELQVAVLTSLLKKTYPLWNNEKPLS